SAQDGWPWSAYKQPVRKPAPPKKANPAQPPNGPTTALLDPQLPSQPAPADAKPAAVDAPPGPGPASPQAPAAAPAGSQALAPQSGAKTVAAWPWRILRTTWTERD